MDLDGYAAGNADASTVYFGYRSSRTRGSHQYLVYLLGRTLTKHFKMSSNKRRRRWIRSRRCVSGNAGRFSSLYSAERSRAGDRLDITVRWGYGRKLASPGRRPARILLGDGTQACRAIAPGCTRADAESSRAPFRRAGWPGAGELCRGLELCEHCPRLLFPQCLCRVDPCNSHGGHERHG